MEPSLEVRAPVTKASGLGTALRTILPHGLVPGSRGLPEAAGMWVVLFPGSEPGQLPAAERTSTRIRSRESSGKANRRPLLGLCGSLGTQGEHRDRGPVPAELAEGASLCFPTLAALLLQEMLLNEF